MLTSAREDVWPVVGEFRPFFSQRKTVLSAQNGIAVLQERLDTVEPIDRSTKLALATAIVDLSRCLWTLSDADHPKDMRLWSSRLVVTPSDIASWGTRYRVR